MAVQCDVDAGVDASQNLQINIICTTELWDEASIVWDLETVSKLSSHKLQSYSDPPNVDDTMLGLGPVC